MQDAKLPALCFSDLFNTRATEYVRQKFFSERGLAISLTDSLEAQSSDRSIDRSIVRILVSHIYKKEERKKKL
jgi:hypothetical protein